MEASLEDYHDGMVPAVVRKLFWDIDADAFDPAAFPQYTIERVLELGDDKAVRWLREVFTKDTIIDVLRRSRRLTPRSANFWALVFDVPRQDVRVLQPDPSTAS